MDSYNVPTHPTLYFSPNVSPMQAERGNPSTLTMSHCERVWERRKGWTFYLFLPVDKHSPSFWTRHGIVLSVKGIN